MEKVRFSNLNGNKEVLKAEELNVLTGGGLKSLSTMQFQDGCSSGVCENGRDVGAGYCDGGAVCTSEIWGCHNQT